MINNCKALATEKQFAKQPFLFWGNLPLPSSKQSFEGAHSNKVRIAFSFWKEKRGRAQAGVEYLMISGFLLFAVIVFFIYSITSYNEASDFSKARNVVDSLANTASQLSGLGNNSSLTIDLEFPENIQSFKVSGKAISLFVNTTSGVKEFFAESRLDLNSASLPIGSGFHKVKAQLSNGIVNFTEVQ